MTSDPNFANQMRAVMKNLKPRIMLDAVADQIASDIFTAMPPHAKWVCYGKLSTQNPQLNQMGQFIFMGKKIEGFWLVNWMRNTPTKQKNAVNNEVQARFADGRWHTEVATKLPMQDIVTGLSDATKKIDGKIIITY